MTKWELARYLIDAKKTVDSILYISDNAKQIRNLDIRNKITTLRSIFYLNCCTVLDNAFPKKKKRELCDRDLIARAIYYERDKNFAHKDEKYIAKQYNSLNEIVDELKQQISHVLKICDFVLPDIITLDFVSHDKELFRLIHNVSPQVEEKIKKLKHPLYGNSLPQNSCGQQFIIFHDTEDIKQLDDDSKNKYATLFECGICNSESMQNFQDSAIKTNVLFGTNIWLSFNFKNLSSVEKLKTLGYYDEFDIPKLPPENDIEAWKKFIKILQKVETNE